MFNINNPFFGLNLTILVSFMVLSGFIFMCISGFVKYNIVLNLTKTAIGTQQVPSNIIINFLSAALAILTIMPVAEPGVKRIFAEVEKRSTEFSQEQVAPLENVIQEPIQGVSIFSNKAKGIATEEAVEQSSFLSIVSDLDTFIPEMLNDAKEKGKDVDFLFKDVTDNGDDPTDIRSNQYSDLIIVFTKALLADLIEGFAIGMKIYVGFVVIDLVVAIVLSAAGMMMLSPTIISIPLKLAVFFYAGGWESLIYSLFT